MYEIYSEDVARVSHLSVYFPSLGLLGNSLFYGLTSVAVNKIMLLSLCNACLHHCIILLCPMKVKLFLGCN
jgi:hypothetical protein